MSDSAGNNGGTAERCRIQRRVTSGGGDDIEEGGEMEREIKERERECERVRKRGREYE